MTTAEEARPLLQSRPPSSAAAGAAAVEGCCSPSTTTTPAGNNSKDRKGTTFKGVVTTALAALAVYLVATTVSRTLLWEDSNLSVEQTIDGEEGEGDGSASSSLSKSPLDAPPTTTTAAVESASAPDSLLSGLIPPYNGTHPTQTTTEDCTAGII